MLLVLLVIAVLAAVILGVALVVHTSRKRGQLPDPDDPREILKRRYAAGEIDEDEYLRRMSGLSQDW
ncbi:SHOCT domain-containing protein [Planobispora longispora]|nr:SHOCT domain-containing protein [Planobispora longispora]